MWRGGQVQPREGETQPSMGASAPALTVGCRCYLHQVPGAVPLRPELSQAGLRPCPPSPALPFSARPALPRSALPGWLTPPTGPAPTRASAWRRTVTAGVQWQSAKSEALGQVLPDSLWVSTTRDLGESLRSPHSVSFPGVPHPSLIPLNTSRAGCTHKDELGLPSLGGETQTELEAIRWQ